MPITILPATSDDVPQMTHVGLLAFQDDLLNRAIIPLHKATPEQLEEHWAWRQARMVQRMTGPGRFFYKAVDEESGNVVGNCAIFAPEIVVENRGKQTAEFAGEYTDDQKPKTEPTDDTNHDPNLKGGEEGQGEKATEQPQQAKLELPSIVQKDLMERLTKIMDAAQKECLGEREDVWRIPTMAVHPDWQRRGIAKRLLLTVCAHADKAGQDVYLESAPPARKLYAANGFEVLKVDDFAEMFDAPDGEDFPLTYMLRRFRPEYAVNGTTDGAEAEANGKLG